MASRHLMNLHATDGAPYQIRLFGRFSLVDPSGGPVRLPDRKTEGLLAILAVSRNLGKSRQEAANILWPGREPANLANLRQALSVLRRTLGADAVETSHVHCRLADSFKLTSDYESPGLREAGGFMPGHEGDWFEDIRLETIESVPAESATVVDHYFRSLQWFAAYDPRSMYAILTATPAMARSLPFREFAHLLETTKDSDPPRGWYAFWLGTVKIDLGECIGLLRAALKEARTQNDLVLASEVCLELGRAYSRTGDLDRAMKICGIADEIAARSQTKEARRNALRLRGTIQFQWHEPEAGDAALRQLERELDSPLELASILNTRAFFEASMGWYEQAEAAHRQAHKIARESGHFRIGILSETTSALLTAGKGDRREALHQLEALAAKFYADDTSQFGIYAEELIAKLHLLEGDKATARRIWNSASRERVRARMSATPLEARRVASVR